MNKLKMQSENLVDENVEKIALAFPNCVTEGKDENGQVVKLVDFDLLKQELSKVVVDGNDERYTLNWAGKKQAILTANSPINATLRPCREESVDFDNTKNLYIEGDNLDVLKLLRETYLNKIKMIYIDPPYNTGNDFVYNDDFASSADEYLQNSKSYDEEGNRMVQNLESNGRFHSDWLSMMYPRLKLARDLLTDDGVIFISIDDNEVDNLKKICNEIFGEQNFLGIVTWSKKRKGSFLSKKIISLTEYCLVYGKTEFVYLYGGKVDESESQPIIKRTNSIGSLLFKANTVSTKLQDGLYKAGIYGEDINPVLLKNDITIKDGIIQNDFILEAHFTWSQSYLDNELKNGTKVVINTTNFQPRVFRKYEDNNFKGFSSLVNGVQIAGTNEDAYEELEKIFGVKKIFDYSKPINYLINYINAVTFFDKNATILDFFSGSATTAHAVMKLNAEDGGNRKFIMVQLPEKCDEKSEAYKAGYKNICEIGKERIRRAGKKIIEEQAHLKNAYNETKLKPMEAYAEWTTSEKALKTQDEIKQKLDIGFRVLKLDSSNMKDVYYSPSDTEQTNLLDLVSNIKEDRSPEDLLFQVMLDMGVMLSSDIKTLDIKGKKVFNVNDGNLVCCFDENLTDDVVTEIAKMQPLYAVFRDSSMSSDSVAVNFDQIFETYSPSTTRKVL